MHQQMIKSFLLVLSMSFLVNPGHGFPNPGDLMEPELDQVSTTLDPWSYIEVDDRSALRPYSTFGQNKEVNDKSHIQPISTLGQKRQNKGYKAGPPGMLWHYDTCPKLGETHHDSLAGCKAECSRRDGCTAFNFVRTGPSRCELLSCPIPVPEPTWEYKRGWRGFSLNAGYKVGPPGMLWHYDICPQLGGIHRDSLQGCKVECSRRDDCTAFNYVETGPSRCELLSCPVPVPEPTWEYNRGWQGFSLNKGTRGQPTAAYIVETTTEITTTATTIRTTTTITSPSTCSFPFIYKGVKYSTCTSVGDPVGNLWCSTKTDGGNNHLKGYYMHCTGTTPSNVESESKEREVVTQINKEKESSLNEIKEDPCPKDFWLEYDQCIYDNTDGSLNLEEATAACDAYGSKLLEFGNDYICEVTAQPDRRAAPKHLGPSSKIILQKICPKDFSRKDGQCVYDKTTSDLSLDDATAACTEIGAKLLIFGSDYICEANPQTNSATNTRNSVESRKPLNLLRGFIY